jgi:acyl dehydratase
LAADWPEAGCEIPAQSCGPFDRAALERYALASGDDNPLHLDPAEAKRAGLPGTPVQGMLMLFYFEPFIRAWRSDVVITRLSAKFLRPVLAGEGICLSGRVMRSQNGPPAELILRLFARAPGNELAILGEAVVRRKLADRIG